MWLSIKANNNLYFRLHHIWPSSSAQHNSVQFGEGTAVAKDLLHLSSKLQPRQLSSQPLHRVLDPGENECGAEEGTWSFFSLSRGVNYDFPSKYEPRETVWTAIHQPVCLHPPEQCVTPWAQRRSEERLLPPSCTPVHTQPRPAARSPQSKPTLGKKEKLHWMTKWIFYIKTTKNFMPL